MTADELLAIVTELLYTYVRERELDLFLVDTDSETYVFQKGGPHFAIVVKFAEVSRG